ncbi:hypothetical protein [Turneriella parva]|uniref:Uncharacterized protein n=1 Tax=Turneriella parva (strain ATCC BAA-1111 / DSM 21527 / NCTC 11395 / H) TaxID=869212 RepID=I4BAA9_TURPD|nr:hypothetical protein [Turneriella parva]AFM14216.1 hypothetical protein Turpa_3582 [Turneriella parva DSM 21527]
MFRLILILSGLVLITANIFSADMSIEFVRRLAANKKKYDKLQSESRDQKAANTWQETDNQLQATFKTGNWYTLPNQCAAFRRMHSNRIEIECDLPDLKQPPESYVPKIDFELMSSKLNGKWEDAELDTPYAIKFKLTRKRLMDSALYKSPWQIGYVHTGIEGFTLYVDAFQILGKREVAAEDLNQSGRNGQPLSYKEKVKIMSGEIAPMMQDIDYRPQFISTSKVKGVLSNGLANSCKMPDIEVSKETVNRMQELSIEKNLPLEREDLQSYARYEICSIVNGGVAESPCLDACYERMAGTLD